MSKIKEALKLLREIMWRNPMIRDGCIDCGTGKGTAHFQGCKLRQALALLEAEPHREASQTGEPTEFTEKSRGRIARDLAILAAPQELISKTTTRVIAQEALEHLAEACDRIDRLTAENERLKKPASRCNCGYC